MVHGNGYMVHVFRERKRESEKERERQSERKSERDGERQGDGETETEREFASTRCVRAREGERERGREAGREIEIGRERSTCGERRALRLALAIIWPWLELFPGKSSKLSPQRTAKVSPEVVPPRVTGVGAAGCKIDSILNGYAGRDTIFELT